ncbi:cupredoxin domain-containing protein [Actinomadura nitritigenes]|uniref:cupredoxin domain-containing protein n=1 Tax=Actinomadura nitritigenes TaxID=134602 RepID=UPI003674802E
MNKSTISTTVGAALLAAGALVPAGAAHATTSPSPNAKTTTVTVTEKEYTLTPSMTNLKPGAYTFLAKNTGTMVHGLAISGPGISGTKMITGVKPGSTGTLKVALKSGTYQMWCPVDNHRALGMHTQLTVAGTGGGGGAPGSPSPTGTKAPTSPAPTTSKPGGY